MQIIVDEATEHTTHRGAPMMQVVTTHGQTLNCFDTKIFKLLQPGFSIDIETRQRGAFYPTITSAIPCDGTKVEEDAIKLDALSPKPEPNINFQIPNDRNGDGINAPFIQFTDAPKPGSSQTRPNDQASNYKQAPGTRKAPEDSRAERVSIEAQVAAKNVTELICAGKIEVTGMAGQLAMAWNIGKLEAALPEAIVSAVRERLRGK